MAKTVHVVNPTAVAFTAGPASTDLAAYTIARDVTLSDAEFGLLMDAEKALLIKSTCTNEEIRIAAKMIKLGRNPGTATVSS
jgi:hypothetical protein